MSKTKMKHGTGAKLRKVSDLVIAKWGTKVINEPNFRLIFTKTSKDNQMPIYYDTFNLHEDYIKDYINSCIKKEALFSKTFSELDKVVSITIEYKGGKKEVIWKSRNQNDRTSSAADLDAAEKSGMLKPIVEPKKVWYGLFDYKDDGSIVIRRGKTYNGCDITKTSDLIHFFKKPERYLNWLKWALQAPNEADFLRNPDTDKDIETLKQQIKRVVDKMKRVDF